MIPNLNIIHFLPLENYPPTLNLLSYIYSNYKQIKLTIYTTNTLLESKFNLEEAEIIRCNNPTHLNRFIRFINYVYFHLRTLFNLIKDKPSKILYYDTLSSFAPIIYCWLRSWKVELYIHYHEYTTPEEYKNGMLVARYFHWFEKKIYNKARWISLTNKQRVARFIKDNSLINKDILIELPNFPPKSWSNNVGIKTKISKPVKIIFVGSLANETMFYKEFAIWVLNRNGEVIWDIYSQQISKEVLEHIKNNGKGIINFKGYVNYNKLNKVLVHYDVGVILYRGHTDNFIYNATNKLFESIACGLDIWFPEELLGAHDYITEHTYPKVMKLDFKNLEQYNLYKLISHEDLTYKPSNYFAEDVYEPFIKNYLLR